MRALILLIALAPLTLSGCTGDDSGPFSVLVTDAPGNIADFSSLIVTVDTITLTGADNETDDLAPSSPTFDLTKLTEGNVTTLFNGSVDEGTYSRLDLHFSNATGVLKADNSTISVKAPSGRIFLNTPFTVSAGNETSFLFDIEVHKVGNGDYQFKPNAGTSGPGKKHS